MLFRRLILLAAWIAVPVFAQETVHKAASSPNILLIICDDLNDSVTGLGGHPLASTPHLDRLARRGLTFRNAYTHVPVCGPSRASLWTGLAATRTGNFGIAQNTPDGHWRSFPPADRTATLFQAVRERGYLVHGIGKLFHNHRNDRKVPANPNKLPVFGRLSNFGPVLWNSNEDFKKPAKHSWGIGDITIPQDDGSTLLVPARGRCGPLVNPATLGDGYHWKLFGKSKEQMKPWRYVSPDDRDPMPDELLAGDACAFLGENHESPFLLSVGFTKPHSAWYVPENYHARFPLDQIKNPEVLAEELKRLAPALRNSRDVAIGAGPPAYRELVDFPGRADLLRRWIQSYLACVSFVDDQVGAVLGALDHSPYRDNTIVIVTSDHGYHMGEKAQLFKYTLWHEAARVPLFIAGPGIPQNQSRNTPVSLLDLYPTLLDLLPKGQAVSPLDGDSMVPLFSSSHEPDWPDQRSVITTIAAKVDENAARQDPVASAHFAVSSSRYRYLRTRQGDEELYDLSEDPAERQNLADRPELAEVRQWHHARLNAFIKKTSRPSQP